MEFDNSYYKKVKDVKTSLNKSFSTTSFLNESFSGNIFQKSAEDNLSALTISNLFRGLEIDDDSKSFTSIGTMFPSCKEVFTESEKEKNTADKIVIKQIEYIKKSITDKETKLKSNEQIIKLIKESGIDFTKVKELISNSETLKNTTGMAQKFLDGIIEKIDSNVTGLKSSVYSKIDDMDLEDLEPSSFATAEKRFWIKEDVDASKLIVSESPVQRISMMLEMSLNSLKISGLSNLVYKDNASEFLNLILTPLTDASGSEEIPLSLLNELKVLINETFPLLFQETLESTSQKWDNVTIPTLQTLFVSCNAFLTFKMIVSLVERVEKLSSEARQRTEISEKVQKKYNESLTTYNSLVASGFLDSDKVFYENKKYTSAEQEMIVQLKKFFSAIGLLKNRSTSYLESKVFDKNILGNAVKKFQGAVKKDGKEIQVDGRIGKDTRLALTAFMEDFEQRLGKK